MADDRAADGSGELAFAVERLIGHDLDGRYRIEALLGRGGMGAVLRARHTFTDQAVAIKVLRPTLAREPSAARRFVREARGTFQVDSEHAVRVTDFGCGADGLLYMVLELLDGHTLAAELARETRLAPRRAIHVARPVALALAAAHRIGLIHRDLKPDNVMLVRRGGDPDFVKVLDFGLVKVIEGAGERALSMVALTQGDVVFGTPDYMAPEQALGQPLDQRTDLYALGATLFEMITGRPPFEAASAMEMLVAQVREPPPALAAAAAEVGVEVEPALDALVARLLAKPQAARPSSALEVEEALAAIAHRMSGSAGRVAHARTVDLPTMATPASFPPPDPSPNPIPNASPNPRRSPDPNPIPNASPSPSFSHAVLDLADEHEELQRPRRRRVLATIALVAGALFVLVAVSVRSKRRVPTVAVVVDAGVPALVVTAAPTAATDAGIALPRTADAGSRPPGPATPRSPDTAQLDRHLAAAEQARRAGNSLKQLAEADLALDLDPRSARARYLMGDALVTTGDTANGCRYLGLARRLPAAGARARAAGCPASAPD